MTIDCQQNDFNVVCSITNQKTDLKTYLLLLVTQKMLSKSLDNASAP
jgi:hypothetical protein